MNKFLIPVFTAYLFVLCGLCYATDPNNPTPISAEQAFDAVQAQKDPRTGEDKVVTLVDVRSRAEYYWVGAPCRVDEIRTTRNIIYIPDKGKVQLSRNGRFLLFQLIGRKKRLKIKKVSEILLSPIAINIPFKKWNEVDAKLELNDGFNAELEKLYNTNDVLIFFCRSGGRSENCVKGIAPTRDVTIYEIDQPNGTSGKGGFEGASYSNVYNGYRGFPNRLTKLQENRSVSWKDMGLPILTYTKPK